MSLFKVSPKKYLHDQSTAQEGMESSKGTRKDGFLIIFVYFRIKYLQQNCFYLRLKAYRFTQMTCFLEWGF